jgi:hypothetical protein
MAISKVYFQIICFIVFSLLYLIIINLYFMSRGTTVWVFAPGTLLVGLVGYWIAGYLYVRYFK